ncbi:hypothetical protein HYZ41_00800 [archaeon]|nr:hypothetical protein [archaeon]
MHHERLIKMNLRPRYILLDVDNAEDTLKRFVMAAGAGPSDYAKFEKNRLIGNTFISPIYGNQLLAVSLFEGGKITPTNLLYGISRFADCESGPYAPIDCEVTVGEEAQPSREAYSSLSAGMN